MINSKYAIHQTSIHAIHSLKTDLKLVKQGSRVLQNIVRTTILFSEYTSSNIVLKIE